MKAFTVATLLSVASAFSPLLTPPRTTSLGAAGFEEVGGSFWDPLELSKVRY